MEIYVKTQTKENPPKEVIDRTVQEIYSNTKHGDFGGFTPETIGRIVFWKENNEWNYNWKPKDKFYKPVERIRRITGYLTGTLDRFNDGKKAEERDRVKHGFNNNKNIINNRDAHNCSLNDK